MGQRWATPSGWAVEHRTDDNQPTYHVVGQHGLYAADLNEVEG